MIFFNLEITHKGILYFLGKNLMENAVKSQTRLGNKTKTTKQKWNELFHFQSLSIIIEISFQMLF